MARLLNIIKKAGGQEGKVLNALRSLDGHKKPVRVEVENSLHRFTAVVALRRNTVVVAKPPGLGKALDKGTWIRFQLPNGQKEIRMEVATPHFNLANGNAVFLCHPPKEFAPDTRRTENRYNTTRFNNLLLQVDEIPDLFRIVDISNSGCRIYFSGDGPSVFPLNKVLNNAQIKLGKKLAVALDQVIPRSYFRKAIGMEIKVSQSENNLKYHGHLIASLERAETEQNRAEAID